MKKIILIFFALIAVQRLNAQDIDFTRNQNVDSLNLWEFSFSRDSNNDEKVGILFFKRKKDIYSNDSAKKITPQITFEIYPISMANSISNFESERTKGLSCCRPICGATIITTKSFVFWSDPWSITSALNCSGVDYTRKNARLILEQVKNGSYFTIEELIGELSINQIKN